MRRGRKTLRPECGHLTQSLTMAVAKGTSPDMVLSVIFKDRGNRECAKLWAGLISGDEMDNQAGI